MTSPGAHFDVSPICCISSWLRCAGCMDGGWVFLAGADGCTRACVFIQCLVVSISCHNKCSAVQSEEEGSSIQFMSRVNGQVHVGKIHYRLSHTQKLHLDQGVPNQMLGDTATSQAIVGNQCKITPLPESVWSDNCNLLLKCYF